MLKFLVVKHRSTTPVSKQQSFATRACIVAAAILTLTLAPLSTIQPAFADEYDDQIRALKNQINQYDSAADSLRGKRQTYEIQLAKLTNQKKQVQAQLDLSVAKEKKLEHEIDLNQKKLDDNKSVLGDTIADLYIDDNISPLELLASSDNIADYVDKQANRNQVKESLQQTIDQINELKAKLEKQKEEVERIIKQQKGQRDLLAKKEAERATLIAQTKGKEAAYQKLVNKSNARISSLYAQQQAAIQAATGGGRTSGTVGSFQFRNYSGELGCTGGYGSPRASGSSYGCNFGHDATIDEFDLYNRECVSYAAWAAKYRFGRSVSSFMGMGNAHQWENPGTAPMAMGATINGKPARGAVAIRPISPGFPLGHAMVVEQVLGDGWIRVSQYNFAVTGEYSTMEIPVNSVRYVHFR